MLYYVYKKLCFIFHLCLEHQNPNTHNECIRGYGINYMKHLNTQNNII